MRHAYANKRFAPRPKDNVYLCVPIAMFGLL